MYTVIYTCGGTGIGEVCTDQEGGGGELTYKKEDVLFVPFKGARVIKRQV